MALALNDSLRALWPFEGLSPLSSATIPSPLTLLIFPQAPPLSLSVALFHAHCLHCKALGDLLSAGVSLMGCNNTVPFSPAKVVESPPSADERTPAGCPVCACVLWQTYKPGCSTPWLSKQGFSTGAQIKKEQCVEATGKWNGRMLPLVIYLSHFSPTERKELKAYVLLWCGKSFSLAAPLPFSKFHVLCWREVELTG